MVFVESVTTLFIYTYVCGADKVINFVLANSGPLPRERAPVRTIVARTSAIKCAMFTNILHYIL